MNITLRNSRWIVTMNWPEVHEAYENGSGSPADRAISMVVERHDVARDQLRSSIIRASNDGMTVVVEESRG